MMPRETAYRLAGRKHRSHDADAEDLLCSHELRLDSAHGEQAAKALTLLQCVPGLAVSLSEHPESLHLRYSLAEHSLEEIESLLVEAGFVLDHSLYAKALRMLTHFCEETRLRNMQAPQRLIKQSNTVYIEAWRHHPHGDHDDTPAELRADR
ncbi:hypothetical protein [Viridibacterium curvum]|uniref:Uncharacterized protein n=1 Tax=Viridibacterium curvum TaxID=1101404 RepID=A0ABP9QCT1_9RHOO